jgi:tetratricopeptide (TPR) repeat protein
MKKLVISLILMLIYANTFSQQLNHEDFNPNNKLVGPKGGQLSESPQVDSLCQKAKGYFAKAQYNDGLSILKKANAQEENNPKIKTAMAWAYLKIGDYDSAISYFNVALKLNPDDRFAQRNLILCYSLKRDYKTAGSKARSYMRSYADDPDGYYTFMLVYFNHGHFGAAIENGQKAVERYKATNDDSIYCAQYWLGKAYYADKDYTHSDEAFQWLNKKGVKVEEKYKVH